MKQRVLLVDDEQNILNALRRILRKEEYDIFSANSAHEALEVLQQITVDVVVTDQEMPGLSGTELLRTLREEHPETMGIMLTGKPNLETALKAINEGEIYRLFTKPCNNVELALAIREALKQKELILQSRRLIDITRMQSKYIDTLERDNPGITRVERTDDGAIVANCSTSLDDALQEVVSALEKAEKQLAPR